MNLKRGLLCTIWQVQGFDPDTRDEVVSEFYLTRKAADRAMAKNSATYPEYLCGCGNHRDAAAQSEQTNSNIGS